jgi:hypothetical protein
MSGLRSEPNRAVKSKVKDSQLPVVVRMTGWLIRHADNYERSTTCHHEELNRTTKKETGFDRSTKTTAVQGNRTGARRQDQPKQLDRQHEHEQDDDGSRTGQESIES